jgi:hypothetical protein
MEKPSQTNYSPTDLQEMRESQSLEITPKFQRRSVWKLQERSFLIDTLIRQMPVPPIFLRNNYNSATKKTVREVIDGQQRITCVLDYIDGKFALSKKLDTPYGGKRFDDLKKDQQKAIVTYPFICQVYDGIPDEDIIEVFRRLNRYAVPVTKQELRNGRYFGQFKQACYQLAQSHLAFWRTNRIFSETAIARMAEVELTSEILIAALDGMQDKKVTIDQFYDDFDDAFPRRKELSDRFEQVINQITETFADDLVDTLFHRRAFFYTLFCAVYHRCFGLPKATEKTVKRKLNAADRDRLKEVVNELSEVIAASRKEETYPKKYEAFVIASSSQTDNIHPRTVRFQTLYAGAFG